ncbi:MFS transporter [Thermogemmatispora tikiterensis]|uniref:MFS transporter n=1 Tax=Thermogemmatispora tikiterensis TaxID=1825093 RepID=UPI000DD826FF|nr:MFS transporter [Thermogemmatispora tikiterensis]
MASEAGNPSRPVSGASGPSSTAAAVVARLDRIPIWALPYLYIGIIGAGFLFTFFDIFDINVSFIQTCVQIVPGCSPESAASYLGLPVLLNLVGYVIGTLILSPLADRLGRRDMLLVTMVITGLGSLYNALVGDYVNFIIARTITGIGVGADLALVNTYINEVAPSGGRARYTSLIFIMSSLGAFLGVWLGLLLTTQPEAFPLGLPFALAGPGFTFGWRLMYGIGALLALIGILMRFQLHESPRWLISQGRVEAAEGVVAQMEAQARARVGELPTPSEIPVETQPGRIPYVEIFGNRLYLLRTLFLFVVWFIGYITVYAIAAGLTSLLAALKFPPPEAGLIVAIGSVGFVLVAIFDYAFGELLERKYWLPVAALLTLIGCLLIALGGAGNFAVAVLGSIVLFFGFNLWVPMTYTWSTEHYPTRARATGFALVDGVGHLGGSVGLLVIPPLIPTLGPLSTFLIIAGCLIVAAVIAQFGTATRLRRLDEVSP